MPIPAAAIPDDLQFLLQRLRERGYRGWIVGGCVRDLLRGLQPKDWDVATSARPEQVVACFDHVVPTGLQHGTVTVVLDGCHYEVTTLRGDGAYHDGRRPESVQFVDDITSDLARRDFTCNAIAIDPLDGQIIDPFGGQQDLAAGILRAVGNAEARFAEDGLRVLRGARFAATLDARLDPATEQAMGSALAHHTFRKVSPERIRDEWLKSMAATRPSIAFRIMLRTGILGLIAPELLESVGCAQNRYHAYDVWGHAMACLDACAPGPVLRLAALLHDIGKPRTREFSAKTNDYTFYNHEEVGAAMVDPLLLRLRFSNEERHHITGLVRHHLICYDSNWSNAAVRRWLRRIGQDLLPDLLQLGAADARGKGLPVDEDLARLQELERRASALLAAGAALSVRDLAIDGTVLQQELGMQPGPAIGKLLGRLLEQVLDAPERNERAQLLAAAQQLLAAEAG